MTMGHELLVSHTRDMSARLLRPVSFGDPLPSRPILDHLASSVVVSVVGGVALDYSAVGAAGLDLASWRGPYPVGQVFEVVMACEELVSPRTRMRWHEELLYLGDDEVLVWSLRAVPGSTGGA
jgi:hypothetical protein